MAILIKGKKAFVNKKLRNFLLESIEDNSSLLDLGCGPKLYSDPFKSKCRKILTVDAWDWVEPDVVADLENTSIVEIVGGEKFDYILMLDFIEHLNKEKGRILIDNCKTICNKKIFLLTPLAEIWTDNHENVENEKYWCYGNQFDLHKSVWSHNDFKDWIEIKIGGLESYYFGYYNCEK